MTYYTIALLLVFVQFALILKLLQYSKKTYLIVEEINNNLQFKTLTKTFYLDEIDKSLEKILEKLNN
jgi:hypothetical protein